MNDKTRNKLNYVLEAVPMSREHKNMLVEVFDEVSAGAGGGGNKETYDININLNTNKVYFKNTEYDCSIEQSNDNNNLYIGITNKELNKVLAEHFGNNNVIDMITSETDVTVKTKVLTQSIEYNTGWVICIVFTEVITAFVFKN